MDERERREPSRTVLQLAVLLCGNLNPGHQLGGYAAPPVTL
jgi:hypothetical protein